MASDYGTYRVFISSSMAELIEERKMIEQVIQQSGYHPFVYERDAGARPWNHEETFVQELKASDLYVGIFWNKYGPYTVQEFDLAKKHGIPRLLFEKASSPAERDPELQIFLDEHNRVTNPDGVTIARFTSSSDLREKFEQSFKGFLAEGAKRGWKLQVASTEHAHTINSEDEEILPYLVDRIVQHNQMLDGLDSIRKEEEQRLVFCYINGHYQEMPRVLVRRFAIKTFREAFGDAPGSSEICLLNFRNKKGLKARSRMADLVVQIQDKLGIQEEATPQRVCTVLNRGGVPRNFVMNIASNDFFQEEFELVYLWLDFWKQIASHGLNAIVIILFCFHRHDETKPTKPFWSRFTKEPAMGWNLIKSFLDKGYEHNTNRSKVVHLDELSPLELVDLESWIEEEVRKKKQCSDAQVLLMIARAARLFEEKSNMHMKEFLDQHKWRDIIRYKGEDELHEGSFLHRKS